VAISNATAPRRDSDVARSLQQEENVGGSRPRSDSELARQLQDEWNANDDAVPSLEGDRVPSPMKKATRHRSDRYRLSIVLGGNCSITQFYVRNIISLR
jgi:hypothetical protein